MNATKEGADGALQTLARLADSLTAADRTARSAMFIALEAFIGACLRRLPSAAAVERQRQRNRQRGARPAAERGE